MSGYNFANTYQIPENTNIFDLTKSLKKFFMPITYKIDVENLIETAINHCDKYSLAHNSGEDYTVLSVLAGANRENENLYHPKTPLVSAEIILADKVKAENPNSRLHDDLALNAVIFEDPDYPEIHYIRFLINNYRTEYATSIQHYAEEHSWVDVSCESYYYDPETGEGNPNVMLWDRVTKDIDNLKEISLDISFSTRPGTSFSPSIISTLDLDVAQHIQNDIDVENLIGMDTRLKRILVDTLMKKMYDTAMHVNENPINLYGKIIRVVNNLPDDKPSIWQKLMKAMRPMKLEKLLHETISHNITINTINDMLFNYALDTTKNR